MFKIMIASPAGEVFQLLVRGALLVEHLRLGIAQRGGHPPAQLRLLFNDRQLVDGRTMSDYNIQRGAVITLVKLALLRDIVVATPGGQTIVLEVHIAETSITSRRACPQLLLGVSHLIFCA